MTKKRKTSSGAARGSSVASGSSGKAPRDDTKNKVLYENNFDDEMFVRLHLFIDNGRHYFNFRNGTDAFGCNLPVTCFWKLIDAMSDMYKKQKKFFPAQP